MNLFNLVKIINKKRGGNANDFIDFLIIVRKWLDRNPILAKELESNFMVNENNRNKDTRLITLNKIIINKPLYNKNKKLTPEIKRKNNEYNEIKNELLNKYNFNLNDIEKKEWKMIELTVKIKVEATSVNEAKEWMEELADNEVIDFQIIESKEI